MQMYIGSQNPNVEKKAGAVILKEWIIVVIGASCHAWGRFKTKGTLHLWFRHYSLVVGRV